MQDLLSFDVKFESPKGKFNNKAAVSLRRKLRIGITYHLCEYIHNLQAIKQHLTARSKFPTEVNASLPVPVGADSTQVDYSYVNKKGETVVLRDTIVVRRKVICAITRERVKA